MKEFYKKYAGSEKKGFLKGNLSKLKTLAITAGVGLLIGSQIYNPNKRTIEAIAGSILVLMLWNFSILASTWLILIIYPFPFAMSWGNSNFVFILIIMIIYIIRISTGYYKFHLDKTVSLPLFMIILAYIFSFNNVPLGTKVMRIALSNTGNFLAAAAFMLLIINFIDDEEKLIKTVNIMLITASLAIVFSIFEMIFPGKVLVPNWLYTTHKTRLIMKGIRMTGPFHDFELNAEFLALNSFIIFLVLIRSRRTATRALLGILLITDLLMMFATITRGAFFSLVLGIVYLMFLSRKDLNITKFFYIVGGLVFVIVVLEGFVANYTTSGSLFDRVVKTTFQRGIIPTNRLGTWAPAIERGMKHPFFGQGPGWDFESGFNVGFWPHNLYLFYFNSLGIFGLFAFLFFVFRIIKSTFAGVKASLIHSPFPEAFMKILHIVIVIFLFDQLKVEYLRSNVYTFFVWSLFGVVVATYNIIQKNRRERENTAPS